jgi:hypothetical protein
MSKIGVIYVGFGNIEYVKESIPIWLKAREQKTGGNTWIISAVSVPFAEYKDTQFANDECATEYLKTLPLDYLVTEPKFVSEAEARNKALFYLLEQGCDWVVLADSDEFYTLDNISNIARFIARDSLTTWFSFSYKNYIFTENQYLAEPFCPPRAFRVKSGGYILDSFYFDNEVRYRGIITRDLKDFKEMSNRNVFKTVANIVHKTWPSNSRGKDKVLYQQKHFGPQYCSFRWNEAENKLEFNPDYYNMVGKPIPEVLTD